jgi:hypothetical protein
MKFAKELEQELVPEWRAKYLDYKVGYLCHGFYLSITNGLVLIH